jgi:hypothetical protein
MTQRGSPEVRIRSRSGCRIECGPGLNGTSASGVFLLLATGTGLHWALPLTWVPQQERLTDEETAHRMGKDSKDLRGGVVPSRVLKFGG